MTEPRADVDELKIEQLPIGRLRPYERNARTHSELQVEQIAASIEEFGFTNPVLVDDDGMIIAGHGRVEAAQRLGMKSVPCIRLSGMSDAQKRAYILADNKLALNAGWDEELLALELGELREEGFDLELTGFSDDELSKIMLSGAAGNTDPDDIPEPEEEVVTQPGDVWLLGAYFQCEDCGKTYSFEEGRAMDACPCDAEKS